MDINDKCPLAKENLTRHLMKSTAGWLKRGHSWVFQQDDEPKHIANGFGIKRPNVKLLEWPSYTPNLNPTETLWTMLKSLVLVR